ncbi:MAG: aminotransferase class I/II-fold pyridoxal phosphate-dependent enzyme [Rhodobacteraceae bacterium]|nr:aminotransferase class I/II-fold pyridoxal phosphate-dependent enzyme [Paracoccaceae bacterium]
MTPETRDLLAQLEKRRGDMPSASGSGTVSAREFCTLPALRRMEMIRSAAAQLGLVSPFDRIVEARRGAEVRIGGRWVRDFSSYDYLGLYRRPEVMTAMARATETWGASAGASRLVGGEAACHGELERQLAEFLGVEAALTFVSGHAANVAVIRSLVGPGDVVLSDALAHNSIYEGIRTSGATHQPVPHSDWRWLGDWLCLNRSRYGRALIAIESLYSMDGDCPDLAQYVALAREHDAWLMLDEAHGLGVLGATGRGLPEEQGIDPAGIDIRMGTLSKALASCGGVIGGRAELIDLLRHTAPGFVYSVGLPPPMAGAASAALAVLEREPDRVQKLRALSRRFLEVARSAGLDYGPAQGYAVIPVMVGSSHRAAWLSGKLLDEGINVMPVMAPAVPDRAARLRFFVTVNHDEGMIREAVAATAHWLPHAPKFAGQVR